ncbi:type II toxin-antitoxin system ParD family antitoxin [Sagittula sp. S175]|uniref:type II toxin-antitoxin system ParD family antitoxin n=1 Tax=Sagittula sp. S175 TaxID=3415129 RepID=UPI003C7AAC69
MNVSLPDPMKDWIEARLKDGRFANTSDYVRHLIRQDQDRAEAVATLQAAIDDGLDSGPSEVFDKDAFRARMRGG